MSRGMMDLVERPYELSDITAFRALAVPAVVETKLTLLLDLAAGARAALVHLTDQVRDARQEKRALEARLSRQRAGAALRPKTKPLTAEDREAIMEGRLIEVAHGDDPADSIPGTKRASRSCPVRSSVWNPA